LNGSVGRRPELADAALARLRPARVVDGGVHVGVEAVLVGRRVVPRRARLPVGEADLDDALHALEAVLPRHDEAQRRAVLVGHRPPVHPGDEQRERVHRLVEAQRLDVRPRQHGGALPGHLLRVVERGELHEARRRQRLEAAQHVAERVARSTG
jgi:hypothetical protein